MGVFRRPELEKDNPVAPQMYVGPRRKRALARAAARASASARLGSAETLATLMDTAKRFVAVVPVSKDRQRERAALLKAIAQAQSVLADGDRDEAAAAE